MKKHQLTVQVNSQDDKRKLADIAASLGMLAKTGPGAGTVGSVGQLMQALADGKYILVPTQEARCAG